MSLLDQIVTIETKVNKKFKIEGTFVEGWNNPNLVLSEGLELVRERKKWFSVFHTQIYIVEPLELGKYKAEYQRLREDNSVANSEKYIIIVKE